MTSILYKILAMLIPVGLGYWLKKIRFFGPKDYQILSKIAVNITLPAAVISSFSSFTMDKSLLAVPLLSFLANWLVVLLLYATSLRQKEKPKKRALQMLCGSGYNMGNFLVPFVQQFLGADGVATASLFDSGNSLMCVGGTYVFTAGILRTEGERLTAKDVAKNLLRPVLIVYFVMIVMAVAGIPVPAPVATIVQPTGNANGLVSMFMIGLMFEIHFSREYFGEALVILAKKYLCGAVLALVIYYLTPFALLTRQVMTLAVFAPIPSLAAIFTEQFDGDVELASFTTSCSFIISCVILTVLITGMGMAG